MTTSYQNRIGSAPEEAIKAPVVAVATADITLSGEQTVNMVDVTAGQRVLVAGQTNAAENGIYVVDAGAWTRAKDWNDPQDLISGQLIVGPDAIYQSQYTGSYVPDVTEVNFVAYISLSTNSRVADASGDHFFTFVGQELAANRNVTLPTLLANDTFLFEDATQTLTNKTLTNPDINGGTIDGASIDGRNVGADGTKLDGIQSGAEANPIDLDIGLITGGISNEFGSISPSLFRQGVLIHETGEANPIELDIGLITGGTDNTFGSISSNLFRQGVLIHETGEANPPTADQGIAEAAIDNTPHLWSPFRLKETIQFHETGEQNPQIISQFEAEAGTSSQARLFTAERVKQSVLANAPAPIVTNVPGGSTFVKKTSEEFRGNTTLADDGDLNIALLNDTTYNVAFRLAASTDGPEMRLGLRYTGFSFMSFNVIDDNSVQRIHNFASRDFFGNLLSTNVSVAIGNQRYAVVLVEGIVKTASSGGAGTLFLQWCQAQSSGDDVYLLDSSVLEVFAP